jgi:glycosyltransferase involved in cell wall biosynthesis
MPVTRPLRIGIDAHAIGERKTGNERYVANLIPALRRRCDHHVVLFFTDERAAAGWPRDERTSVRLLRPAHPVARIPFVLPFHAARERLDVLFVQYSGPPVVTCPVVTVVHDVAFAVYPQFFSRADRLWMRRTIPSTMRRAAGILTVSEFSREEISRVFGIPSSRIDVAHNGVDPKFVDAPPRPSPMELPFFVAVGNLQPRKNLDTLLRGFRILVERHPEVTERLVIVGQEWYRADAIHRESQSLLRSGRVVFSGYVSDDDLIGLLQRATAFAYPSIYEGFGLPVVEAMALGTPVLVGDIPVMREVAGDAAMRLPPSDPEAWADGLLRSATDAALRRDLASRGRARSSAFTWDACAARVLTVLERAAVRRR